MRSNCTNCEADALTEPKHILKQSIYPHKYKQNGQILSPGMISPAEMNKYIYYGTKV